VQLTPEPLPIVQLHSQMFVRCAYQNNNSQGYKNPKGKKLSKKSSYFHSAAPAQCSIIVIIFA
jgi:hypothetical protein